MTAPRLPLTLLLAVTSLLSACRSDPAAPTPAQADTRLSVAATPTPTEATATPKLTDLTATYPGGTQPRTLALDKSVPLILVHGLGGWGRDEGLGLRYWGGLLDVQADLRAQGYTVYTASLGPVSSNWDRAAELYAQIRGGCVDYGAAHAQTQGHARTDPKKCYAGFYPGWDATRPVNLLGHSMGGQTARLLVKLLDDGDAANRASGGLFTGGRAGWVRNVMTVSSPNSGSPAADTLQDSIPMFKNLILAFASSVGGLDPENFVYDFDLGHWGLSRAAGETFTSYNTRVFNSGIWTSRDQAAYDLSVDGSAALNTYVGRSRTTKYFSWETNATSRGLVSGWHYPNLTMNAVLSPIAYPYAWPLKPGLGNISGRSPGGIGYDSSWWANDGIVPNRSMNAPLGQTSAAYTGQITAPGSWYRLGRVDGYDHIDITGNLSFRDVKAFYRNQAAFLAGQ
ncbi:triacylglycerol lipase [Deinococcus soli (ex Cha et al. 2016)]|uniref:Triacylglycerol lipase n=2 Tax=Deinococcus soli (ex Cha et al. 2016) TaxID=1309411 RepID=A0ACC6KDZ1_9DEIO|nr:triacylglycerol lipase [Deinococcus soli (ex Cha et al. 2016)]MDR6217195.1 triacylglycerol lipase [Deinococcus soli (ex Cha et al. 2016)]MDR6326504.1 triacylglycerol lipase [Deinococcus soli (ex Cha et al. 2016)]MDR6750769.1 triacylglycerol lipase [Deinococcus soli (ex Cha et al. 2016)]